MALRGSLSVFILIFLAEYAVIIFFSCLRVRVLGRLICIDLLGACLGFWCLLNLVAGYLAPAPG